MSTRQGERNRRKNRKLSDQWMIDRYAKGYAHWTEYRIPGVLPLVRGRRFRVKGERGWFIFTDAGRDRGGDYLNCVGPFSKKSIHTQGLSRVFAPDRVLETERRVLPIGGDVETKGEQAERLGLNQAA